jgi:predicted nucleotidyltransferase component of viral defense system
LKRVLRPVLGERADTSFDKLKLQARNIFSPSRIIRIEYSVPSIMSRNRTMRIKIEVNVSERTPFMLPARLGYDVPFQDNVRSAKIVSFAINEMLGTKMHALFQRDQGRNLFDLYSASIGRGFSAEKAIDAFMHYMAD